MDETTRPTGRASDEDHLGNPIGFGSVRSGEDALRYMRDFESRRPKTRQQAQQAAALAGHLKPNRLMHLGLTLLTGGLWAIVWLFIESRYARWVQVYS